MGGEGAMMHMITSLKNNKRRRRKRKSFSNDSLNSVGAEKPVYDFPEATPEVLSKIKKDMLKDQKTDRIRSIVIIIFILTLIIYGIIKA
ncbi:hypothetical protein [uncultured Psychroserpens sp.]|uniref:hypothetical protein n=1 Tax=uncultured Psychroserpens sp. TaxID=255436 RepID=UPI002626CD75|nr:hypothetical protein [uncultured Psychroserpens sp.]